MPRSGPGSVISRSLSVTVPVSGRNSPAMRLISVVLPAPENPRIATNSPFSISKLIPRRTETPLKFLLTLFNSRNAMRILAPAKVATQRSRNQTERGHSCPQQHPNARQPLEYAQPAGSQRCCGQECPRSVRCVSHSYCPEPSFHHTHEPVQNEPDNPNREDA